MASKINFLFILLLSVFFVSSCFLYKEEKIIELPATPVLGGETGWAVITVPYVSFRDTPGSKGIIVAYGRRGDILRVSGRKIVKENASENTWLRFDQGWLSEDAIKLFPDKYKAENGVKDIM